MKSKVRSGNSSPRLKTDGFSCHKVKTIGVPLFLVFGIIVFVVSFCLLDRHTLTLTLETNYANEFHVFWDIGRGWNKQDSTTLHIKPTIDHYTLPIPEHCKAIRVDPSAMTNQVITIREVTAGNIINMYQWNFSNLFRGWEISHDLEKIKIDNSGIRLRIIGNNPKIINKDWQIVENYLLLQNISTTTIIAFLPLSILLSIRLFQFFRLVFFGKLSFSQQLKLWRITVQTTLRSLLSNILLMVFSFTLVLIVAEIAYRTYLRDQFTKQANQWSHALYRMVPKSLIEYDLFPNTQRQNKIPDVIPAATWSYQTNTHGFRGQPIDLVRPNTNLYTHGSTSLTTENGITRSWQHVATSAENNRAARILFLGDSYTFGWAVNDSETYVEQLKNFFEKQGQSIETVNLGVPGYNTKQEYAQLLQWGKKYAPDLIILGYVMNDAEPQMNVYANPDFEYQDVSLWILETIKFNISKKFPSITPWYQTKRQIPSSEYLPGFHPASQKWVGSKRALHGISKFCQLNNIPFLVIILPAFTEKFDNTYSYHKIHNEVALWGHEFGVEVIDLLPHFLGTDNLAFMVEGDGHPNAQAYKKIAELLVNPITKILATRPK